MNARLTAIAAAMALLSAPTFAAGALEVYGKVNLSLQRVDDETQGPRSGTPPVAEGAEKWELKSNASRLGVKGELAISDETTAFYQMEFAVGVDDGTTFSSRNAGAGLRGNFGQVFGGRWDTPYKELAKKVDLFWDYDSEFGFISTGKLRAVNMVQYSTPKMFDMMTINVASLLQETYDTENNAASVTNEGRDGLFDATSVTFEFEVSKDLFLGVGMDSDHQTGAFQDGAKDTRFVASYTLGDWKFGFLWQAQDEADGIDANNDNTVAATAAEAFLFDTNKNGTLEKNKAKLFSVSYKVGENGLLKLQRATSDIKFEGGEQTAVGYDHKLAKNVTWFAWYSTEDRDAKNTAKDILATGLEVKF